MPGNNPTGKGGFADNPENINKNGSPAFPITDLLRSKANEKIKLKDKVSGKITSVERKQAITDVLWGMAISGNIKAIREVLDRIEGKSKQSIEFEAPEGMSINYIVPEKKKENKAKDVKPKPDNDKPKPETARSIPSA